MIDRDGAAGSWIAWFARNPVAANLLMAALLAAGWFALTQMRTEEFPRRAPTAVTITAGFTGGTPEIVEEAVVLKIEEALEGVEGIKRQRTTVTAEQAVIVVEAVDGHPLKSLKDAVTGRVNAISSFSAAVDQVLIEETLEEERILNVQLYGESDHRTLKQAARRVRERLLSLPAVSRVLLQAARADEIAIEVDEARLRAYGLDFTEVAEAVRAGSVDLAGGELQTSAGRILLQGREQAYHGADFTDLVLRRSLQGGLVRLGDVATIRDGFTEQAILSRFQGKPSIGLDVMLVGRDSIVDAAAEVKAAVDDIRAENWLPADVAIATWQDEAESLRDSLRLLSSNALLGMGLVLVLLALFLEPRIAFWVAVGMPVAFAGTFFVIGPGGLDYSINNLTIFAFIVVLGIVVDDAIVIAENVHTHIEREGHGVEAAIRGAREVAVPATFGVLTTVAAFLPLTVITGNFGGPFRMIAVVTIISLLFSLVESKLILPAHLAGLRPRDPDAPPAGPLPRFWRALRAGIDAGFTRFVEGFYVSLVDRAIRHRYQSLAICLALLVLTGGLVGGGVVRVDFFGEDNDRFVNATVTMPAGTAASVTHRVAERLLERTAVVSAQLMARYELETDPILYTHLLAESDDKATVMLQLPTGSERPFLSQEVLDLWREAVGPVPGAQRVNFYIDFEEESDLRVELSSPAPDQLAPAIALLQAQAETYPGIRDLASSLGAGAHELDIRLREEAALLGLRHGDVMQQVRDAIFGIEAQRIQRDGEELKVRVRYPLGWRDDVGDLRALRIRTPDGGRVRLSQIAEFHWVRRQGELERIDGRRVAVLTARIEEDEAAASDVLAALQQRVFPDIERLFPAVSLKLAGDSEEEEDAAEKLVAGFLFGLIGVFALLAIPLRSYGDPLVILLAVPYGIIGALLGHLVMGIAVGFLSLFGILALTGVVVNDALILMSRYNQLRAEGYDFDMAVVSAGRSRIRAVFLTSITAFFGLLPLILERSEQAQELIPMAVSLAFGVLFATVITLLIVPVFLAVREDVSEFFTLRLLRTKNQAG